MTDIVEPPLKKICIESARNGECDITEDKLQSEKNLKEEKFESFKGFEIVKILSNSNEKCAIAVQCKLKESDDSILVHLQKLPFNQEKLSEIFSDETTMRNLLQNDIYYNQVATLPPRLNEVKVNITYPAGKKHLKRFEHVFSSFIYETPELYERITKEYVNSALSSQWIYNILEHKKEADRIVCEDMDDEVGFILLPDLKWSGEQVEDLYLQALVMRRDICSLRDLRAEHIPLLENIYDKCTSAIEQKYGVGAHKLRVYFHYQPSFYHLHVHFSALSFDAPGMWVGRAHLLQTVLTNLRIDSDYYLKATLGFVVNDTHPLKTLYRIEDDCHNANVSLSSGIIHSPAAVRVSRRLSGSSSETSASPLSTPVLERLSSSLSDRLSPSICDRLSSGVSDRLSTGVFTRLSDGFCDQSPTGLSDRLSPRMSHRLSK